MNAITSNSNSIKTYKVISGEDIINDISLSADNQCSVINDNYAPTPAEAANNVVESKENSVGAKVLISAAAGFAAGFLLGEIMNDGDESKEKSNTKLNKQELHLRPGDSLKMKSLKLAARGAVSFAEISAASRICNTTYQNAMNGSIDAAGPGFLIGMGATFSGLTHLIWGAQGIRNSIAASINRERQAEPLLNPRFIGSLGNIVTGAGLVSSAFGIGPIGFPIVAAGTGMSAIGTIADILGK